MWKTAVIVGGVVIAGVMFTLWCAVKAGSDEDDFWGLDDPMINREADHGKE